MKKTITRSLLAASIITTLLFAGCQKDNTTLRLRIDHFGGNSKVYMNGNAPVWSTGDIIWIDPANTTDNSYTLGTIPSSGEARLTLPNSTVYSAVYPFGIGTVTLSNNGTTATANINTPHEQRYTTKGGEQVVNAPMAGCTLNDRAGYLTFRNLGALLAINIECNFPTSTSVSMYVDEVVVRSMSQFPLWGEGSVELTDPNAVCQYSRPSGSTDDPYSVVLRRYNESNIQIPIDTLNNTTNISQTVYVYVPAVPTNVNNRFSIEVHGRNTSTNAPINMTHTQSESAPSAGNIRRNMIANVSFPMHEIDYPAGTVHGGVFTVGMNGNTPTKVFFASGNLQYNCTTHVWRIAPNQYDFVGGTNHSGNVTSSTNNSINSSTYTGWIDLFGWATSGFHVSTDPGNQRYLPTSWQVDLLTNYTDSEVKNCYGYGPSSGKGSSFTGNNVNYDWGVYHSNPASGNDPNPHGGLCYVDANDILQAAAPGCTWRTLTKDEWDYLINSRTVHNGTGEYHSWSKAKYYGVLGILLYPDNWGSASLTTSTSRIVYFDDNNPIPNGCVFLPSAGRRAVDSNTGNPAINAVTGFYWSSTGNNGDDNWPAQKAYSLTFNSKDNNQSANIKTNALIERYYGYAVRLVTNVPNN